MSASPNDAADRTVSDAFEQFERAKRTNAKCAARGLAIRDELRRLKRRKIELVTMSKMNAGQRNIWLEDLTEETIIPYSMAWNRKVAEQIQATFPPEIRSMIYDYLLDDDMWDKYVYALQAVMSAVPPDVNHCRCLTHGHRRPRVPHYLYAEYMGSMTSQEIVEKVYRSDWFEDQTLYDIPLNLHKLIHEDAFGAGFDPASCIRSLDIFCLIDEHRNPPISHDSDKSCHHSAFERRYIGRDNLKSNFYHLLAVVDNEEFQYLEVTFMQRNVRIGVLEEALEAFSNVYQAFKKAGIDMRIQWQYISPTCDRRHEHSRDVGDFFNHPRSTWKHRMYNFLEKMMHCMESRHIHFVREPSLDLSNTDFVHRMWDDNEKFIATDDEDSQDDSSQDEESDDDDSETGSESN